MKSLIAFAVVVIATMPARAADYGKFREAIVAKGQNMLETRKLATGKPLLEKDVEIIRAISDPSVSPDEAEKKLVRYVREAFLEQPLNELGKPPECSLGGGNSLTELVTLFYFSKGRIGPLWEYSRLTGVVVHPARILSNLGPWKIEGEDPELLKYELYNLVSLLNRTNERFYLTGELSTTKVLPWLVELRERYPEDKLLENFLIHYPFEPGSYYGVNQRWNQEKAQGLRREYFDALIKSPSLQKEFLVQARSSLSKQDFHTLATDLLSANPEKALANLLQELDANSNK